MGHSWKKHQTYFLQYQDWARQKGENGILTSLQNQHREGRQRQVQEPAEAAVDAEVGYFEWDGDYRIWPRNRLLNLENTRSFREDIELLHEWRKVNFISNTLYNKRKGVLKQKNKQHSTCKNN